MEKKIWNGSPNESECTISFSRSTDVWSKTATNTCALQWTAVGLVRRRTFPSHSVCEYQPNIDGIKRTLHTRIERTYACRIRILTKHERKGDRTSEQYVQTSCIDCMQRIRIKGSLQWCVLAFIAGWRFSSVLYRHYHSSHRWLMRNVPTSNICALSMLVSLPLWRRLALHHAERPNRCENAEHLVLQQHSTRADSENSLKTNIVPFEKFRNHNLFSACIRKRFECASATEIYSTVRKND